MVPFTTLFNYIPTPFADKARRAYNTVIGADFNRDAYEEAQKHATKLEHYDMECNEEFDAEEEWTGISRSRSRSRGDRGMDFEDEAFVIKKYHGRPRQLSFKLSEKAAEAACEAAGVSREYLGMALKFVALEVSRDIGWITHCKTAVEAVRKVKMTFPVLEDMKRAFEEGSGKRMRLRRNTGDEAASASSNSPELREQYRDSATEDAGGSRFYMARSGSKTVYDPELHAGVEVVPVMSTGPYRLDGEEADDEGDDEAGIVDSEGFARAL